MQEKLVKLYNECINELKEININILNNSEIGEIDIKISKGNYKRYGCCKQKEPDKDSCYIEKKRRKKYIRYNKFKKHHIEISKWVMELNDDIIKNTIIHEIIHCFPYCNNHGNEFKKYAKYINSKLGYDVSRLGNKEKDFKESNLEYVERINYKYRIICKRCGQMFYRQRFNKNLIKRYRCVCGGKLSVERSI